ISRDSLHVSLSVFVIYRLGCPSVALSCYSIVTIATASVESRSPTLRPLTHRLPTTYGPHPAFRHPEKQRGQPPKELPPVSRQTFPLFRLMASALGYVVAERRPDHVVDGFW